MCHTYQHYHRQWLPNTEWSYSMRSAGERLQGKYLKMQNIILSVTKLANMKRSHACDTRLNSNWRTVQGHWRSRKLLIFSKQIICVESVTTVAASDDHRSFVVFHSAGYTVYRPQLCQASRLVSGQFDLSTRRSTRLQLAITNNSSSRLCDVRCDWSDAVMVGNQFIYVSQPSHRRLVVIDLEDSHQPVEVHHTTHTYIRL